MFGGILLGEQDGLRHRPRQQDATGVVSKGVGDNVAPLAVGNLLVDRVVDRRGGRLVGGNSNDRGVWVVFGLGDQIAGDKCWVGCFVTDDQDLTGASEKVDLTSPRPRFAAVTHLLPGPTTFWTLVTVSVP